MKPRVLWHKTLHRWYCDIDLVRATGANIWEIGMFVSQLNDINNIQSQLYRPHSAYRKFKEGS